LDFEELSYRLLTPTYAIFLFVPSIINDLGFTAAHAQLLSVPPWVASFCTVLTIATLSDRARLRGPFIIMGVLVAMSGYLIEYFSTTPGLSYAGIVLTAIGTQPAIPVLVSWASGNAGGETKRGVVLAMVPGLANLGGFVSCARFEYMSHSF
jgi:hypothetical protein